MTFTAFESLAQVSLGYKSLQNDFYYVNQATIETYGIEARFLEPIFMLGDLDGQQYLQQPDHALWIFLCRDKEADLRGTGALRYIHAMSERPAAQRKQSSRTAKRIREVLEAQSGGLWYAPKAKPRSAHLWLRKAVDTVYAPFVFEQPSVVDQRCNYAEPVDGLSWELVGAALTTTAFAYSVEINGSASMGAGALEAPTTKLRDFPVLDPRPLTSDEQQQFIRLARTVWSTERPVNWGDSNVSPGPGLRALDAWVLARANTGLLLEQVYGDLREACRARINVARDKDRTRKKHRIESVATVAKEIADRLARLMGTRQFPENFVQGASTSMSVSRQRLRKLVLAPLLDKTELSLLGEGGKELLRDTYELAKAEVIARAVLLGRENFLLPDSRKDCERAVSFFLDWFDDVQKQLETAIRESALGTGYEDALRLHVFTRLGVHPMAGARALPREIQLSPLATL